MKPIGDVLINSPCRVRARSGPCREDLLHLIRETPFRHERQRGETVAPITLRPDFRPGYKRPPPRLTDRPALLSHEPSPDERHKGSPAHAAARIRSPCGSGDNIIIP